MFLPNFVSSKNKRKNSPSSKNKEKWPNSLAEAVTTAEHSAWVRLPEKKTLLIQVMIVPPRELWLAPELVEVKIIKEARARKTTR